MKNENAHYLTSQELLKLLKDFRAIAGEIETSSLYPLLVYYKYLLSGNKQLAKQIADRYNFSRESIVIPEHMKVLFSMVRSSDLMYIKFIGRYSEPVYTRDSEFVPMREGVHYFFQRAEELSASTLLLNNIHRFIAYNEDDVCQIFERFTKNTERRVIIVAESFIDKSILTEVFGNEPRCVRILEEREMDELLCWESEDGTSDGLLSCNDVIVIGLFPDYSKKSRTSERYGDAESRIELDEIVSWRKRLQRYASSSLVCCVVRPVVLYSKDTETFRKNYVGFVPRVLSLPFAVKKYTTTRLFMIELGLESLEGEVQFCSFENRDEADVWHLELVAQEDRAHAGAKPWDSFFAMLQDSAIHNYWELGDTLVEDGLFRGKFLGKRAEKNDEEIKYTIADVPKENPILELNVRSIQDGKLIVEGMPLDIFEGSRRKDERYFCKEGDIILTSKGTLLKSTLFPVCPQQFRDSSLCDANWLEKDIAVIDRDMRWLGVYIPLDTYRAILERNVSLLISSNLLILRFSRAWVDDNVGRGDDVFSYWTRYVALVMRHEILGVGQLKNLQTGGVEIINLTTEKVLEFKIPKRDPYQALRDFVENVEGQYILYERNCKLFHDNLAEMYSQLK